MTQTGWIHLGILLLAFVGVVAFVLRRAIFPVASEGSDNSANWYGGGGYDGHSGHHDGSGHAGHGSGDS